TSGAEALRICSEQRIDMVLLDIMMPEMDGYQVCEKLKQDPATRDIPIIFITAKHETESIVKGFEVGGIDYLLKPFNGMELLARIDTHMRLRFQELELKEAGAINERFIAIIADELRSPITALNGVLHMLANPSRLLDSEQQQDYIVQAALAAESLNAISSNLIQWSVLQIESIPLRPVDVDLHNLFAEAVNTVNAENPQKGIEYQINITEGQTCNTDESLLQRVAQIILTNAAAFSHKGGEVSISANQNSDGWQIIIEDHGVGMSAEEQQNLFKLDKHVVRTGTAGEIGSGMGLLLGKELMERLNGTITIESESGKGTQVLLNLPVQAG
ncbi:MAG: response regulator, partial [Gammaproteobacteria bacterium]|nr:response regulator [Gammaproteobacteria bacterium]